MLERARIQNQNACMAESRINEGLDGFNLPHRTSSVGATTNLNFSRSSYDTPAGTTAGVTARRHRENHLQLPPYLSGYTMIEVDGDGDCLPLSVAYHIYSSTLADDGMRVCDEVTQFMLDNFQVYGNTLARDEDELIENARAGRWLGEEFLNAAAAFYNAQFTLYWHGEMNDPSTPYVYTSSSIDHDPGLKAILWKNSHFTPLVLKGRSGARDHHYRSHSVSSSSQQLWVQSSFYCWR